MTENSSNVVSFEASFTSSTEPKYKASMAGTVTPPDDLNPAIEALSPEARAWLDERTKGRQVLPVDIAKAADFERGE